MDKEHTQRIRVTSDGRSRGTKVFGPDGKIVNEARIVDWHCNADNELSTATITLYANPVEIELEEDQVEWVYEGIWIGISLAPLRTPILLSNKYQILIGECRDILRDKFTHKIPFDSVGKGKELNDKWKYWLPLPILPDRDY